MKGKLRFIIRYAILFVILGIAYWQQEKLPLPESGTPPPSERAQPEIGGSQSQAPVQVHGYERFDDAEYLDRKGNDGDSFFMSLGGREVELRLYFVDAPETYYSDRYEAQRRRVEEQARVLGGVTTEQVIEIGAQAREFTKKQLKGRKVTVYTNWERVFNGERFYAFVELPDGSDLGTRLVEEGLVRIHTKGPGSKENPVPTPTGDTFFQARDKLRAIEAKAVKAKRGVWAYSSGG